MGNEDDRPGDRAISSDLLFRVVATVALGLGSLSGLYTVGQKDDLYRAEDAGRDLQIRDERLAVAAGRIATLERLLERIDEQGPRTPNREVMARLESHEERIDALEDRK